MKAFGDSITAGYGASSPLTAWPFLAGASSAARPGDQAADLSNLLHGVRHPLPPAPPYDEWDAAAVLIGTNDVLRYGGNVNRQGVAVGAVRAALGWLALPGKQLACRMEASAGWVQTPANLFGRLTTQHGARIRGSVSGDSAYVAYIRQNDSVSGLGAADVFVDGARVGALATFGGVDTRNGAQFTTCAARFTGLGPGEHAVEVVVTSAGGQRVFVEWVAGSGQDAAPPIAVSDVPPMTPAALAAHGFGDSLVAHYGDLVLGVADELIADGLDVRKVPLHGLLDVGSDYSADGIHPNDAGHAKIAGGMLAALG